MPPSSDSSSAGLSSTSSTHPSPVARERQRAPLRHEYQGNIIRDLELDILVDNVFGFTMNMVKLKKAIQFGASTLQMYRDSSFINGQPELGFIDGASIFSHIMNIIHDNLLPDEKRLAGASWQRRCEGVMDGWAMPPVVLARPGEGCSGIGAFVAVTKNHGVEFEVGEGRKVSRRFNANQSCMGTAASASQQDSGNSRAGQFMHRVDVYEPQPVPIDWKWEKEKGCLTDPEVDAALYVSNMLRSSLRHYVTGILVVDIEVSLVYGDHEGMVMSKSFDFIKNPELLVFVVAAITNAHPTALGFSSFLHIPKCPTARITGLDGLKIKFFSALDDCGIICGPWHLRIDLNKGPTWTPEESVGRCTQVLPVVLTTTELENPDVPAGLEGKPLVLKIAWPSERKVKQGDELAKYVHIQEQLRGSDSAMGKHIAKIICGVSASPTQLGLPRAFIGNVEHTASLNYCALVMPRYFPMSSVRGKDDFVTVLRHVVPAHHYLFEVAGLVHRDISDNNVMWYNDERGKVQGVLCDFDMTRSYTDIQKDLDNENGILASIRHGASYTLLLDRGWHGTPYMVACELLGIIAPVQTYRHDAESLLYFIMWHFACHDPRKGYVRTIDKWCSDDYHKVGDAKARAISMAAAPAGSSARQTVMKELFGNAHKEYKSLAEDWVPRLAELFTWSADNFDLHPQDYADTLPQRPNEEVLYAKIMKVIGGEFDSTCECRDNAPLILEDHEYLPGVQQGYMRPDSPETDIVTDSEDELSLVPRRARRSAHPVRPVMIALRSRSSEDVVESKAPYGTDNLNDEEDQLNSSQYSSSYSGGSDLSVEY